MRKVTVEMIETFDGQQHRSESLAMQHLSAIYQNALHDIALDLHGKSVSEIKQWMDANLASYAHLLDIVNDMK